MFKDQELRREPPLAVMAHLAQQRAQA